MTAAIYRSSNSADNVGGGAFTVNRPASHQTNDWFIFIVACTPSGGQVTALPSGLDGTFYSSDTLKIGYKLAGAEATTYSFSTSGGSNPRASVAAVLAYKGGDPSTPPDVGSITSGSGTAVVSPATSMPSRSSVRLHIGYGYDSLSSTSLTSTPPPGMSERIDISDGSGSVCVHLSVNDEHVLSGAGIARESTLNREVTTTVGIQLIIFQAPLVQSDPLQPNESIETLLELTHQDEASSVDTIKLYSGRGVTFTGGEEYERRLLNSPEIEQRAADAVVFGGVIATTISAIRLDNKDGVFDTIYAYGLALGRACVVKTVIVTDENASDLGVGSVSNAEVAFSGVVAAMTPDGTVMVVQLSDRTTLLDVPLQIDTYDGSAGFGGGAENTGLTQPLLLGRGFNVLPASLGTISGRETYQVHSRTVQSIQGVAIRGVSQVDSGVAVPGVGEFRALVTDGAFELGSTPDGEVTSTAKGDATYTYANNHGEIITRMMSDFGPRISESFMNGATFSQIDTIMSGEIGIYFPLGDHTPTRSAIDRVVRSGGLWLSGGHDGLLRLALARPGPTEILHLTEPDIVELRPMPLPASLQPPPHEISMFTERNWHQLTDFATSVTASKRRQLSGPGRTVISTSTIISERQAIERHWDVIDSLWFNDTDGQRCIDQMRAFVELGLISFRVVTDRYRGIVELGMRVEIESYGSVGPSYGLLGGFSGIVVAYREIPAKGRVSMILIGPHTALGYELREDGGYELREDGSLELRE